MSPSSSDGAKVWRRSVPVGTRLIDDLFANGHSIAKVTNPRTQYTLGVRCSYGSIGWTADHITNEELANSFRTWLHEFTGRFVQGLRPMLEPDFRSQLESREKGPSYHVKDKMGKEFKAKGVTRSWWTTATIFRSTVDSMMLPRRHPQEQQPCIFLAFGDTVNLCLQLVKNGPVLRVSVSSGQVVFLHAGILRCWVEGQADAENWSVLLTMSTALASEAKMASIRKTGRALKALPIIRPFKVQHAKFEEEDL